MADGISHPPDEPPPLIDGRAVKNRRLEHGWARPEFARRSGVSLSYIKLLEGPVPAGRPAHKPWPSRRMLRILADTLGCTIADITFPATRRCDDQVAA